MQVLYRLAARYLANRPHLVSALLARAKRTPYTHITSRDGKREYMRRWWLFNPYDGESGDGRKHPWLPVSVRIHEIVRRDDDDHLHDHPWNAQTLILRGYYIEERENPDYDPSRPIFAENMPTVIREMHAGDTAPIRFGQFHRIVYGPTAFEPAVTLFITFGYKGTWGFKVDGHKIPWRDYLLGRAVATHELYKTGDPDAPATIKDRNGEVVLGLCKHCGRGEIELEQPCDAARNERFAIKA